MFAFFVAGLTASHFKDATVADVFGKLEINHTTVAFGQMGFLDLDENHSLTLTISTDLNNAPTASSFSMHCGTSSISGSLNYVSGSLSCTLTPKKLEKLYKHSGKYYLDVMVYEKKDSKADTWRIAEINFIANGEVFDNFTDVEWDFQPPHKEPKAIIVKVFTYAMFAPLGILLILLLVNGISLGYMPRNPIYILLSLGFVVLFGRFLVYYIQFWRSIHFEDMLKSLCVIIPVLGIALRFALVGRAKEVKKAAQRDAQKTSEELVKKND